MVGRIFFWNKEKVMTYIYLVIKEEVMKKKEQHQHDLEPMKQHSLVCNDELFIKDLIAIVDDTMRVEEEKAK